MTQKPMNLEGGELRPPFSDSPQRGCTPSFCRPPPDDPVPPPWLAERIAQMALWSLSRYRRHSRAQRPYFERLDLLYRELVQILKPTAPKRQRWKRSFFRRTLSAAITVGQARGVLLLALAQNGLEVAEYTAKSNRQWLATALPKTPGAGDGASCSPLRNCPMTPPMRWRWRFRPPTHPALWQFLPPLQQLFSLPSLRLQGFLIRDNSMFFDKRHGLYHRCPNYDFLEFLVTY